MLIASALHVYQFVSRVLRVYTTNPMQWIVVIVVTVVEFQIETGGFQ